jgi:hypothetical protein
MEIAGTPVHKMPGLRAGATAGMGVTLPEPGICTGTHSLQIANSPNHEIAK